MNHNLKLQDAVKYSDLRVNIKDITLDKYITTDNLLPNKQGVGIAVNLPPQIGNIQFFEPKNILVSNIRPYLKKIWFSDKYGGCSADVLVFVVQEDYIPKFIYYSMLRDAFFDHMVRGSKGTKMPRGDKNQILEFAIPNFRTKIQEKIASVLSSLDDKIELNNRINSELENLAKTIYDYWFVQFDFPDENGKPYKSSGGKMVYNQELKREIPAGWEVANVSNLLDFNPPETLAKGTVSSYIDMNALPTSGFMTGDVEYKEFNGGMKFRNGDVVMARITPCLENGKTALITLLNKNEIGFGSTEFIVIRGKNRSLSSFAAYLARSESFRNFAISNMTGTSGRKRIDYKIVETFIIPIPENRVLSQFENIVSQYFQLSTINTKQNQQLTQLRDWLLPMLMNGQITIK